MSRDWTHSPVQCLLLNTLNDINVCLHLPLRTGGDVDFQPPHHELLTEKDPQRPQCISSETCAQAGGDVNIIVCWADNLLAWPVSKENVISQQTTQVFLIKRPLRVCWFLFWGNTCCFLILISSAFIRHTYSNPRYLCHLVVTAALWSPWSGMFIYLRIGCILLFSWGR